MVGQVGSTYIESPDALLKNRILGKLLFLKLDVHHETSKILKRFTSHW